MTTRFAINGVGRIGRALIRIASSRPALELVAVNDLADCRQLGLLLARDSLHGRFDGEIDTFDDRLVINGTTVRAFREPDPAKIPWLDLEPTIVVDATGLAKIRAKAQAHRRGPIRKVLVSANADGMDMTICLGINHDRYDPAAHHLLSAASCTTNCLAPMVHVLDQAFGVDHGLFNTVHSFNNDQRLLSYAHPDPRRARGATFNMIPTTTSASHAIHQILPNLEGRLDGFAVRVPTPNVSLIDLVTTLRAAPSVDEINRRYSEAAAGALANVLAVSEEKLVSFDFLGDPHSAIIDLPLTTEVDRHLYRVVGWYDNEWGHASRIADLLQLIGGFLS